MMKQGYILSGNAVKENSRANRVHTEKAGLFAVVLFTCLLLLSGVGMRAMADDSAFYSDIKDQFDVAFFNSGADHHCTVKGKAGITTGDIVVPETIIVRKGDGISLPSNTESITYTVTEVGNFLNTTITSIVFPETVTKISGSAFLNCTTLSGDIVIPDSVITIEGAAFKGCTGLTGTLTLGTGLEYIGISAFSNCGFTGTLTIPENLTTIMNYAFQNCSGFTGNLTIPQNVTTIKNQAFSGCTGFDGTLRLLCTNSVRQGETFEFCSGFTGLEIADGITSIETEEFHGCSGMKGTLRIPESVTSIKEYAFQGCSGFTGTLIIPSGITELSAYAFDHCSGLTGLVLPDEMTTIYSYAFNECTNMTGTLSLPDTLQRVDEYVFGNCGFTGSLTLPEGLTTINLASFACPNITDTVTIPSTITGTSVADAFIGMFNVRKINNNSPAKLYLIKNFIDENDEESFFVKSGTTEHLGAYTYGPSGSKYHTTVSQGVYIRGGETVEPFGTPDFVLPADVTAIQEEAFAGIAATVVEISESCTSIGARAFKDCPELNQIRIPENCEIGEDAFDGCISVTIYGIAGSPAEAYCQSHDNCMFAEE